MTEIEIERRREQLRVFLEETQEEVKVLNKALDDALSTLDTVKTEEDARAYERIFECIDSFRHVELF